MGTGLGLATPRDKLLSVFAQKGCFLEMFGLFEENLKIKIKIFLFNGY